MGLLKALSLNYRVNAPGIAAALLLFYTASSGKPWWSMRGGSGERCTFSASVSPFAVDIEVLGRPVAVPILPYLTLAARLSVLLAAAAMLAGSLLAGKPWSKPLVSVRGLALPILFLLGLLAGLRLAASYVGADLPLTGEFELRYTIPYEGRSVSVLTPAVSRLTEEYWVALAAGALSALAKAVHGGIARKAGASAPEASRPEVRP